MIKVDGGFAKVVNVVTSFEEIENIENSIYVKLIYADFRAKEALKSVLIKEHGFFINHSDDDILQKIVNINPFGGI